MIEPLLPNKPRGVGVPTLRINQQPGSGPGKHEIAVDAELPGFQPLSFSREIEFALSSQRQNGIGGIFRTYLRVTPRSRRRHRIPLRVSTRSAGRAREDLFGKIFAGRADAAKL